MKRVFLILALAFLTKTKCSVTTLEVNTERVPKNETEKLFQENIPILISKMNSEPKYNSNIKMTSDKDYTPKSFEKSATISTERIVIDNQIEEKKSVLVQNKYDAKSVYLEDVVFALKNQQWSREDEPCLNATLHMLRSLQNFSLWAVWDWDSISSQPQGLLFGSRYELGNFDECLIAPWTESQPELRTQYCLAEIVLERTDKTTTRVGDIAAHNPYDSALDFIMREKSSIHRPLDELTWGGCVPASCGARATERLMATLLARSHLGTAGIKARIAVTEPCQRSDQPRQYDGPFYGFLSFVAVMVVVTFICTYLNCNKNPEDKSLKSEVIQAFCLKENAKDLLKMKKEGAEVLYGIRFLTIVFIVMDHQAGIYNAGPVTNGIQVDQAMLGATGIFVLHNDLFVDTFFVLSGFLVATALKKLKEKTLFNPFLLIIKRYIRLVVAFAVVVFFYATVYPYIGSGPLWNRSVAGESDPCRKNWWVSLLMLGNYVDSENICIVVSWYIPCDFHFFLVTTLVFWLYTRLPRLGLACASFLTIASVCIPGIINYMGELPAIQLFTYDFLKDPRANELFHISYIKSHTRSSAYIIGVYAGYIFAICRDSENLKRISTKKSIMGALVALATMTAVMMMGALYLWRSYHPLEGALYAALNRPIWALAVALLILCCCLGRVPYVESFLSWYPWVPLSRLAYGLYLTHTALIARNVFVTRSPQHNDYIYLLTSSLGVIVIGCLAALAIWLFAEGPINNLFAVLVRSSLKRAIPRERRNITQSISSTIVVEGDQPKRPSYNGHLHTNLPSSIEFSSKM